MTTTLVFGGARSGKSAYAEKLAASGGNPVVYIATAQVYDGEMAVRIAQHRRQRPAEWTTVEETLCLGAAIERHSEHGTVILIDCLTLWLSNLLFCEEKNYPEVGPIEPPERYRKERESLMNALERSSADVILVSNEVGMGITPQGAISRWFVDEAGRMNQAVAACCDQVFWVAAGLPLKLKGA
jgi:adenosylcobinamide kinase/adenosylcobinamide-phosphate guanylyltransferase